jgi:methionyl-tRNA synthetase
MPRTDYLLSLINRLLDNGVPPTAIANSFDLDVQVVKDLLDERHVKKFGTAELSEAIHALMWEALEDMRELMRNAPIAKRMQVNMSLLTRASAMIGNQEPDSIGKLQAEMAKMTAEVREIPVDAGTSIYETNPVDAPTDDPEEGSTGRTY